MVLVEQALRQTCKNSNTVLPGLSLREGGENVGDDNENFRGEGEEEEEDATKQPNHIVNSAHYS